MAYIIDNYPLSSNATQQGHDYSVTITASTIDRLVADALKRGYDAGMADGLSKAYIEYTKVIDRLALGAARPLI